MAFLCELQGLISCPNACNTSTLPTKCSLHPSKDTLKKIKTRHRMEEIITDHISNKLGPGFKKKPHNSFRCNVSLQKIYECLVKHMKRCSIALVLREMQTKATVDITTHLLK